MGERQDVYDAPVAQGSADAGEVAAVAAAALRREETPEADAAISYERGDGALVIRFNCPEVKEIAYARQASKELKDLAISTGGNMLLSLENVTFLSSVGVAAVVSFDRAVRTVGGKLKICGMRSVIRYLFSASGLDQVLDVYDTKAAALWAFRSAER